MNEFKGIAFDLEGTIINLESEHHHAHLLAAAEAGVFLSWQEAMKLIPNFIGGPDEKVAEQIAELANDTFPAQDILKMKKRYFNDLLGLHKGIRPREGFPEILEWIEDNEMRFAFGTVTEREVAIYLLKRAGLLRELNETLIVAREDVNNPKPAPDVYFETARRLGIEPRNQLVFEDSIIGLMAAKSAGSNVYAIPSIKLKSYVEDLKEAGAEKVFLSWFDSGLKSSILRFFR